MKAPYTNRTLFHDRLTSDEAASDASCGGAATESAVAAADAAPSNRASDSCNGTITSVVSLHVDSLELSFTGVLLPGVSAALTALRDSARSPVEGDQARAQLVVGEEVFAVWAFGKPYFPFALENGSALIKLADRKPGSSMPVAYCEIRNARLLMAGPEAALAWLTSILRELVATEGEETVSRADLAADVVTPIDMESWGRRAWVTRVRAKDSHSTGDDYTGWRIGNHSNPISLRLYDKTFQLDKIKKGQDGGLYGIWDRNGWVPWDSVWRVEVEIRRAGLAQFGLKTLHDLLNARDGLWRHALIDVVRLTVPNAADSTRARWPLHPLWEALASLCWAGAPNPLSRLERPTSAPSDDYFGRQMKASVSSLMGRDSIADPVKAIERLTAILFRHLSREEQFSGITPEEALLHRAQVKGRRYFTSNNVIGGRTALPSESPAARSYRRASDGG